MTESEAFELGNKLYSNITSNVNNIIKTNDYIEFVRIAINALEKQIPKKPKDRYKTRYIWDSAYCPICNCGITARWVYCQCCGQKLDWESD